MTNENNDMITFKINYNYMKIKRNTKRWSQKC